MNSVKNLSFPKRDQPKPTEKSWQKNCLEERSSLSKSGKLELSRGSPAQQGSRWGPDPPATVADVSNCRDVSKASGHGLRLLSTPKMSESMMDWYDWWLFQNTLVVFSGFRRGWKTTQLWKVRGFFFLAPFASQLCRPFRFCCWLFSISWMRISECLKKYLFGMDMSWLCIKCWYLDSFCQTDFSFHLSSWPWPLFLSRSQEAALLGIVCASWVCNLQLGLLKCLNWTRERERRTNTCPLHFNIFLSFYLRLAIWAVAEQALSSPVASLVE